MKNKHLSILLMLCSLLPACTNSCGKKTAIKDEASAVGVFFESPAHEATVASPVEVKFGVKGMTVRPALEDLSDKKSGHHHILIDNAQGFIEEGQVVPVDANHIHFGKGETTATIELTPGVHTLTMQFADGAHISYGKKMAATITVTVKEAEKVVEDAPAPEEVKN